VVADVYVWCYALLVVHARKEEEEEHNMPLSTFHLQCFDIVGLMIGSVSTVKACASYFQRFSVRTGGGKITRFTSKMAIKMIS